MQELHMTRASPVTHLHPSPPLCKHSSSPCSWSLKLQSKILKSHLGRWLERGCCNQIHGKDLTIHPNSFHLPCVSPAVNLHLFCAEAWLKAPSCCGDLYQFCWFGQKNTPIFSFFPASPSNLCVYSRWSYSFFHNCEAQNTSESFH